jgi:hypothetical protein
VGSPPAGGRHLRRPRFCAASLLLLTVALLGAPASAAATSPDTAATYAYLQAGLQLDQAILRNAAASRSAVATLAERVGHECHGVLAGAPDEEAKPPSRGSLTPRARGERQRSELQMVTIEQELRLTTDAALYQPDQAAIEAWAEQTAPLSWSDPQIAPLARFDASKIEEAFAPPVADVCVDMQSWAQSGYHRLSSASLQFEAAQRARNKVFGPRGSIDSLLKAYEGPPERALIRETQTLRPKILKALDDALHAAESLRRQLGLPEGNAEESEKEPVLGHGKTRAGTTFIVREEAPRPQRDSSCEHSVSIEIEEQRKGHEGFSSSSGSSTCMGAHSERRLSSGCSGEVESIETAVPASVRTVRLQLSNGQTITSHVIRVPRRYGGPGGIYVQAVRGYSPSPVSLTELDARGKVVGVLKIRHLHCRKEPSAKGPTFVSLASGHTPSGEPFTIEGVVFQFGRNQTNFSLTLNAGRRSAGDETEAGNVESNAFRRSLGMECPPREFAIVYGILAAPGAAVLARTPEGLVPLTEVPIAADLHSGGPLVYGVFPTLPSELIVRTSNGATLYSESLAAKDKEETEFCEGYTEA